MLLFVHRTRRKQSVEVEFYSNRPEKKKKNININLTKLIRYI